MDYEDFEIEVKPSGGREYEISVRSRAGEAREVMRFPLDELALENRLKDLQIALLRSGGKRRRIASPEEQTVQNFGRDLFDSLIANEVRVRYDVSQRLAYEEDKGLRLILRILDPELAALPWEFLYDPRKAEYLCLSRDTPIVRYPDLAYPVPPLAVRPPLRILGMAVSPTDLNPLDIDREKERVEKAIRPLQGLIALTWVEGQTWRDLQDAMQGGPWHIFHFIGHGGFNRQYDEGLITLADEEGRSFELSATKLAVFLKHRYLKLVVLNACEGAYGGKVDIFSSTAAILLRSNIPAVLAMQYEITDKAAIEFSRSFYNAMARGMPIEGAVSEARKAIYAAVNNTVEWGTPVLYLRAQGGRLFDVNLRREQIDKIYADAKIAVAHEDWNAAIEKLKVVLSIDSFHKEARDLLSHALEKRKVSEMYAEGLAHYRAGRLQEALNYLQRVKAGKEDYKDTANLISKIETDIKEGRIIALYNEAERYASQENFNAAIEKLEDLLSLDPDNDDASAKLERLKERREIASLYAIGRKHYDMKRWSDALELFEQIKERTRNYKDVNALVASAQSELAKEGEEKEGQARIDKLYRNAELAMSSNDWATAIESFQAILNINPYDNVAATKLIEAKQGQIASFYRKGHEYYSMNRWMEALDLFEQVKEAGGEFPDLGSLIAATRKEIEKIENTKQRESRIAALSYEADGAIARANWTDAIERLNALLALDPENKNAAERLKEAKQQQDLEILYLQGQKRREDGQLQQALKTFKEVAEIRSDYKDIQILISETRLELEKLQADEQERIRIDELLHAVEEAVKEKEWAKAIRCLQEVPEGSHDAEVVDYRKRIEQELNKENVEKLYLEGEKLVTAGHFDAAITTFREIQEIAGEYKDVDTLIRNITEKQKAQEEDERLKEAKKLIDEATRAKLIGDWAKAAEKLQAAQALGVTNEELKKILALELSDTLKELDRFSLYDSGTRYYEAGKWRQALEAFEALEKLDRHYKDTPLLIAQAKSNLELQGRARRKKVGILLATGLAVTVIMVAVFLINRWRDNSQKSTKPAANSSPARVADSSSKVDFKALEPISVGFELYKVALSPDGDIVASIGNMDNINIWRTVNGEQLPPLMSKIGRWGSVAIRPVDGKLVVSGDENGTVRFWRLGESNPFMTSKLSREYVFSSDFSADGQTLICAGFDGGGNKVVKAWQEKNSNWEASFSISLSPTETIVAINPNRLLMAIISGQSNSVEIRSLNENRLLTRLEVNQLKQIDVKNIAGAFSPDGEMFALGLQDGDLGKIILWRIYDSGSSRMVLGAAKGKILSVAYTPAGQLLATGWNDGSIHLWRTSGGPELPTLTGSEKEIKHLTFSANGKMLAGAGGDKIIRLWQVTNLQ